MEYENANTQYKRIWRKFEEKNGTSFDVIVTSNPLKNKSTVTTIQTEKEANSVEITRSAFVVLDKEVVTCSLWDGHVGKTIRHYEKAFEAEVDLESGRQMIQECYESAYRIPQNSIEVAKLSEYVLDYVKMIEKKYPNRVLERPHDTYP